MNERSIVAAILAAGLATPVQQGADPQSAARRAVSIYQAVLSELAKRKLPSSQPHIEGPSSQATLARGVRSDRWP
jgi:hypothetical protein